MTKKKQKNYAFIDGNNLYLGAKSQDINLNYGEFRKYLRNKFHADKAFLFIGYDHRNTELYSSLQSHGYILVFKPTIPYVDVTTGQKTMKGNVDAELVLHAAAIEYANYNRAIIVSSDGDFACLAKFLKDNDKLAKIITPTKRYSKLLKPYSSHIVTLQTIQKQIKNH